MPPRWIDLLKTLWWIALTVICLHWLIKPGHL